MDFLDITTIKGLLSGSVPITTFFIMFIKHTIAEYKTKIETLEKQVQQKDQEIIRLKEFYESRLLDEDRKYEELLIRLYTEKE